MDARDKDTRDRDDRRPDGPMAEGPLLTGPIADGHDRIVFRKEDVVALDRLPSAVAPGAAILRTPRTSGIMRLMRYLFALTAGLVLAVSALLFALEGGLLDDTLTRQARAVLDEAIGPELDADVGETRLRLADWSTLALEARNVAISDHATGRAILSADAIRMALDPMALVSGRLVIDHVDVGNADVDASLMATGAAIDWSTVRVDRLAEIEQAVYGFADMVLARLAESPAARFSMASLKLKLPKAGGDFVPVVVDNILFERDGTAVVALEGRLFSGGLRAEIGLTLRGQDGRATAIRADVAGLPLAALMLRQSSIVDGPLSGVDAPLSLVIDSARPEGDTGGALSAKARIGKGMFWADRVGQTLDRAEFDLTHDRAKGTIVVSRGDIVMGQSRFPLEAAIIDLDRVNPGAASGFAFELLVNDGLAASESSGEKPVAFNAKASATLDFSARKLNVSPISISTRNGNIAASLGVTYGDASPEISFSMRSDEVSSAVVKQLWPFWISRGARKWLHANLFDGTVKNGEVDLLVPAGAIREGQPTILEADSLSIRFDISGTRFNFLGAIPPARNASGHFEMSGRQIAMKVPSADIFLASGDVVHVADAAMTFSDVYEKPLMADIALSADGAAKAMAELATFEPIAALQKTEYVASDFSGMVTARISARVGLIADQKPPKPDWQADLALADVALERPVAGRKVSGIDGTLSIGSKGIRLEGDARIDDVPFTLALSQALDDPKGERRRFSLTGKLDAAELATFAPGLDGFVSGRVDLRLEADNKGNQKVVADLGRASLSVPFIGWKKGTGVAATVAFSAQTRDGVTRISDFRLKGDGFGAEGEVVNDRQGLVSATFSRLQLTPSDRYRMSLRRTEGGMAIDLSGEAADLRPIVGSLKSTTPESRKSGQALRLNVKLGKATGYNKEVLSDLSVKMSTSRGRITALDLTATTRSGQAVVASRDDAQKVIEITSGDAGALFRFADVYRNMNGGLLNIKLRARDTDSWRGSVDVRNFALINEERLKSIVSTPASQDGKSLNDAVRAEIDVTSQKFRRGFARILVDGPVIRVENGVVRGDQVGATFQGAIRDEQGRMDMTGTFMPAYGLNRLFAELPLIGTILGNGSDRGLLGITFKLSGPADEPKLTVNPLSLIAPGVFRNIFEFE